MITTEPIRILRLKSQIGCLNPGDIAGFPASKAARIIAEDGGVELIVGVDVDEDGNLLRDLEDAALVEGSNQDIDADDGDNKEWVFDPKKDPFMTDGISKQASLALHAAKLHTVDAVRQFIAETPEDQAAVDRINAIEGITDAQAEKIVKLYGTVTEHSDE